jgi:phage tail sheath protein FI
LDSYGGKLCFGDWVYWLDTTNNVLRVVSPQAFFAGTLANLSPEQSSLNKQMQGIVGTQKSYSNTQYSQADLTQFAIAGIDVITNPVPGGSYFGARFGHNSSSNPVINGDNYVRMTNYIAGTLSSGMGLFIGKLQSATVRNQALATISSFLDNLQQAGMIGDPNGGAAYSVTLNASNNPPSRVALGYMQVDVQVKYLAIIEKFLVNVEGGTSVQIIKSSTALAA